MRQREVEDLLSSPAGVGVSKVRVRRAARALAANASAYGGGPVSAAAQRLAADVRRLFEILGDRELQQAFGARDAWQIVATNLQEDIDAALARDEWRRRRWRVVRFPRPQA